MKRNYISPALEELLRLPEADLLNVSDGEREDYGEGGTFDW